MDFLIFSSPLSRCRARRGLPGAENLTFWVPGVFLVPTGLGTGLEVTRSKAAEKEAAQIRRIPQEAGHWLAKKSVPEKYVPVWVPGAFLVGTREDVFLRLL